MLIWRQMIILFVYSSNVLQFVYIEKYMYRILNSFLFILLHFIWIFLIFFLMDFSCIVFFLLLSIRHDSHEFNYFVFCSDFTLKIHWFVDLYPIEIRRGKFFIKFSLLIISNSSKREKFTSHINYQTTNFK